MDELIILTLILFIVAGLGLEYAICYNSFQKYLIKINEVEGKIDAVLRDRFDLLCNISDVMKEHIDKDVMTDLTNLNKDDLSSFDLERKLVSVTREYYELKFKHRDLIKIENFTTMDFNLKENEATLDGYILYYNDNISKFNRLVRMFPSNIVGKIARFHERTFYDGKNMNDKNVNDFKL